MKIEILFHNENAVIVEKPHGWLATPSRDSADKRPCVGRVLQEQLGCRIFPVHRLDFELGGLMLWALNFESHRGLQTWFENGRVQKTYSALTKPGAAATVAEWVEWRAHLVRGKKRAFEALHGKLAITRARVVQIAADSWLWELQPLTGRAHQLRFEMANHGVPILGDALYGGVKCDRPNWIALRAVRLDFSRIPANERFGLPDVMQSSQGVKWDVHSL